MSNAERNDWPEENAINNTSHNGECDAPVYRLFGKLYRINPVNRYALTWTGKKWIESQKITNEMVRLNGFIKSAGDKDE